MAREPLTAWADRHAEDDDPTTRMIVAAIRQGDLAAAETDGSDTLKAFAAAFLFRLNLIREPGRPKANPNDVGDLRFVTLRPALSENAMSKRIAAVHDCSVSTGRTRMKRAKTKAAEASMLISDIMAANDLATLMPTRC